MSKLFPKQICSFIYFSFSSLFSLFILILVSIFTTWVVRGWFVMSNGGVVDYKFPTNFIFQPCLKPGVCSYPYSLINLRQPYSPNESILKADLPYTASLKFRVSESESNRLAGMFMVKFTFENDRRGVVSSCTTSTSLPYRSRFIRILRRLFLWPLLIFDYLDEYHTIHVKCPDLLLFDGENDEKTALDVRVEIQNVGVHMLNNGRLELTGHLSGLQYYFYWWPITSTFLLFFWIFWCWTMISLGIWFIQATKKHDTTSSKNTAGPESAASEKHPTPPTTADENSNDFGSSPFDFDREDDSIFSSMRKRNDDENENVYCYQRRGESSRVQRALLDLDDSNLGT